VSEPLKFLSSRMSPRACWPPFWGRVDFSQTIVRRQGVTVNIGPYGSVMASNSKIILEIGKYEVSNCFYLSYGII
jgi:hypothetical protein